PLPGRIFRLALSGNYAYATLGYTGVTIINISNAAAPQLVTIFDTPGFALDIAVAGNYAYIADGFQGGLQVFNVSNAAATVASGSFPSPSGDAAAIGISGTYAYLADGSAGLRIINISNPAV